MAKQKNKKKRIKMNTYTDNRRLQKIQLSLFRVRVKVKHDSVLNICWYNVKLKEIIFPSAHLSIFLTAYQEV